MPDISTLYDHHLAKLLNCPKERGVQALMSRIMEKSPSAPIYHDFVTELQSALERLSEEAEPSEIMDTLRYMYKKPLSYKSNKDLYLMLCGLQALSKNLISRLRPVDAQILYDDFKRDYPARGRYPIQKEIAGSLLRRSSGEA